MYYTVAILSYFCTYYSRETLAFVVNKDFHKAQDVQKFEEDVGLRSHVKRASGRPLRKKNRLDVSRPRSSS